MNRSTLRWAVIVLTVITAAIHLFLGVTNISNPDMVPLNYLFILNSIGYITLLLGVLGKLPFLPSNLSHYLLMAFAAVTIAAWVFMSGDFGNTLALITKVVEVLLIIATFLHLRAA